MASSTSDPMAMAIPPSDMVLMVTPMARRIRMVMIIDKGKATTEIRVVRRFIRKKNSTSITINAPFEQRCV